MPELSISQIVKNRDGAINVQFSDGTGYLYSADQLDSIKARIDGDFEEWARLFLVSSILERNPADIKTPAEDGTTPARSKSTVSWDMASKSQFFRSDDGEDKREDLDLEDPKTKTR